MSIVSSLRAPSFSRFCLTLPSLRGLQTRCSFPLAHRHIIPPAVLHRNYSVQHNVSSKWYFLRIPPNGSLSALRSYSTSASASADLQNVKEGAMELVEFVREGGGHVKGVQVAEDGVGGLTLEAAAETSPGQCLISLPPQLQLTYRSAGACIDGPKAPALQALISAVPEELWAVRLGLRLLVERARADSRWWPYIATLPQRFSVPIFWSQEDILALQYPPLLEQVKRRCRFLHQFSQQTAPALLTGLPPDAHPYGGQALEAGALGWAFAAVSSRAFRVHGPSRPASLLPLVDMCNHSFSPNCQLQLAPNKSGAVEVVAKRAIAAGEPLELSYGPLSNDLLLLDYGFLVPDNPHDCVELAVDTQRLTGLAKLLGGGGGGEGGREGEELEAWQVEALKKLGLPPGGRPKMVTVRPGGEVDPTLLAAARVVTARRRQDLRGGGAAAVAAEPAVEKGALRLALGLCSVALSGFPTTLQEDAAAAQDAATGVETRMAVALRASKKQFLVRAIERTRSQLQALP